MLARASSDAGTRLRRSKSTSTVHRPVPSASHTLNPDLVYKHALAAATAAFARAQPSDTVERSARNGRGSSGLSRSKSNAGRKSTASQGSHFPRELGFRSLHPPRDKSASNAKFPSTTTTSSDIEDLRSCHITPSTERPLLTKPSITLSDNLRPNSQPKPYRPSASSSITSQQLRKARSMYYASSVQTGSPIARPPVKYLTTPPPINTSPALLQCPGHLPIPSSATSPLASPRLPVTIEPGTTVDEARDKYLRNFNQRSVKHKPSLFLAPFRKRQDKSKEKKDHHAFRPASSSADGQETLADTTIDLTLSDFIPQKEKEKRSFSNSIRNRIKKVFRRTSNTPTDLPIQQVEASRDYFSSVPMDRSPSNRSFKIPSPDDDTLQRIRARVPAFDGGGPALIRPASRGSNRSSRSNRSLHSETNFAVSSASRITSWGSSSAGDTLTQHAIKRLTVIHEAKDSIGSEADRSVLSKLSKRKSNLDPGPITLNETVHIESLVEEPPMPVDPKRMFSALMKEINCSKTAPPESQSSDQTLGPESDVFHVSNMLELQLNVDREPQSNSRKDIRSSISSDHRPSPQRKVDRGQLRSKSSSIKSLGRSIKSTIRAVTPTKQPSSTTFDRIASVRGAVRIPRSETNASSTMSNSDSGDDNNNLNVPRLINFKFGHRRSLAAAHNSPPQRAIPTAGVISQRIHRSKNRWQAPLEENYRSQSIQRRHPVTEFAQNEEFPKVSVEDAIVQTNNHEPGETVALRINEGPDAALVFVAPESPKSPEPRHLLSPLSPSVYSRNTDGASILPNDSVISLDGTDLRAANEGGSVVNITCETVRSYVIGTPSPRRNTSSTRSSREWNAWLSHEVSELSCLPQQNIIIHEQYNTPSGQHQRECKRDKGNNTTVIQESIETPTLRRKLSRPTTPQQGNTLNEEDMASNISFHAISTPTEVWEERKVSLPLSPAPVPRRQCLSSAPSQRSSHSSQSQSRAETPKWERMNERFPYIDTGRRSSSYTSRHSRQAHTPTSGSSSLKSKATPSLKIYSDFTPSPTNRTPSHVPVDRPKRADISNNGSRDDLQPHTEKENTIPSSGRTKKPSIPLLRSSSSLSITRTKLLQPLSLSKLNRSPSSLVQYTTTPEEDTKSTQWDLNPENSPPRSKLYAQLRPGKLTVRPKSAFNLRGTSLLTSMDPPNTLAPETKLPKRMEDTASEKVKPAQKRSLSSRTLDRETLRNLLRPHWAASESPRPSTSPDTTLSRRSVLHVKQSSSSLALNKEPSPGSEERCIDSVIGDEKTVNSVRRTRSGSMTPGQRMAERFLRKRGESSKDLRPASMIGGSEREFIPAFL